MEDKQLNEHDSLRLITQMIQNTQQNLERGNGNILITWGISTLLSSLCVGVALYFTGHMMSHWLWFLNPIIGYTWTYIQRNKRALVYTHIDRVVKQVWIVIGLTAALFPLALMIMYYIMPYTRYEFSPLIFRYIPMIEILICSLGLSITGMVIDFKALRIGGNVGIVISLLMIIIPTCWLVYFFGVWALVSMIIPGIKLNRLAQKSQDHV